MTSRDIPIIFSAPMIRALLDGRKTMTRRLAWREQKITHQAVTDRAMAFDRSGRRLPSRAGYLWYSSPWQRVKPGDRLWVRESFGQCDRGRLIYRADDIQKLAEERQWVSWPAWSPSIHMRRGFSRLTLIVTATKIERLQDISEEDAIAEGIARSHHGNGDQWVNYPLGSSAAGWLDPHKSFRSLWASVHGPDAWDANPEVVALTFRVVKENIDAVPRNERVMTEPTEPETAPLS